ncbi:MAG: hypothetical protein KatS3mg115_0976 [Candidatus Poribacteria bacterium]|nr:MAG: hypothetical protein KatS3mg115_0976 [Candidatus Poribacteria bacterium]
MLRGHQVVLVLVLSLVGAELRATGTAPGDYLDYAVLYSDGRVTRFNRMPVRVRLGPVPYGFEPEAYQRIFRQGRSTLGRGNRGV